MPTRIEHLQQSRLHVLIAPCSSAVNEGEVTVSGLVMGTTMRGFEAATCVKALICQVFMSAPLTMLPFAPALGCWFTILIQDCCHAYDLTLFTSCRLSVITDPLAG